MGNLLHNWALIYTIVLAFSYPPPTRCCSAMSDSASSVRRAMMGIHSQSKSCMKSSDSHVQDGMPSDWKGLSVTVRSNR